MGIDPREKTRPGEKGRLNLRTEGRASPREKGKGE